MLAVKIFKDRHYANQRYGRDNYDQLFGVAIFSSSVGLGTTCYALWLVNVAFLPQLFLLTSSMFAGILATEALFLSCYGAGLACYRSIQVCNKRILPAVGKTIEASANVIYKNTCFNSTTDTAARHQGLFFSGVHRNYYTTQSADSNPNAENSLRNSTNMVYNI